MNYDYDADRWACELRTATDPTHEDMQAVEAQWVAQRRIEARAEVSEVSKYIPSLKERGMEPLGLLGSWMAVRQQTSADEQRQLPGLFGLWPLCSLLS